MSKPDKNRDNGTGVTDKEKRLLIRAIATAQRQEGIDTSDEQAEWAYKAVFEEPRVAFFRLDQADDTWEEYFVRALAGTEPEIRFDLPRRDFLGIEGAPLSYWTSDEVLRLFGELSPLQPLTATAHQGLATANDPRFVRQRWEVPAGMIGPSRPWVRFAKGGAFSRFYYDFDLVVDWEGEGRRIKEYVVTLPGTTHWSRRVANDSQYFRSGLTWSLRTQRGLNTRVMPEGCIFGHKGPAIFPVLPHETNYLLGLLNSSMAEYICRALTSFGSYEVGVIQRLPVPRPTSDLKATIGTVAQRIHDAKACWDEGNEISTRFQEPWLLGALRSQPGHSLAEGLDWVLLKEAQTDKELQGWYAELDAAVFDAYNLSPATRTEVIRGLGERPPELIWPQMEGKTPQQKRVEHVLRLVSFCVKQAVEADPDGIVPLVAVPNKPRLADRVRTALAKIAGPERMATFEGEIVTEIRKGAGYKSVRSLDAFLANHFFAYHARLYKNRPILWHLASRPEGDAEPAFSALVHYHRFDRDALQRLRGTYVRSVVERLRREAAIARREERTQDALELQAQVEEVQEFDRKLQQLEEGAVRIVVPWKTPEEQPQGWCPDLDDGVKVNLLPLQQAGLLRYNRVIPVREDEE